MSPVVALLAAPALCDFDDSTVKNTLPSLATCADHDTLIAGRETLVTAQAALAALSGKIQSSAVANRFDEIAAMLAEEIAGLACVAERCAEQEEIASRDWHAIAWASYHDAQRD